MSALEPQVVETFKAWLVENGAHIHPDVQFEPVPSGFNVIAGNNVPADTTVVAIPFSLAITPDVSKAALKALIRGADESHLLDSLSERQLVCTYVCLHQIAKDAASTSQAGVLRHGPYIDTLPSAEKLRTPLHFSSVELEAFRGSNLYGATLDRQRDWQAEWQQCRAVVSVANSSWGEAFTWDRYLTASTYLSSRAFPSTVLSESPSLVTTPSSYPVLLPGIDALNHARAHPVSWVVSGTKSATPLASSSSEPSISLVIHAATPRGSELFNNYGPKPNAELILGYGFSLPHNPDDTIVLKIGGPSASHGSAAGGATGGEVGAVLAAVRVQNDEEDEDADDEGEDGPSIEDELCAADMLAEMAQSLYDRLPPFPPANAAEMRPEVLQMLEHYLEGQRDILQSLIEFANAKEASALQKAREQGLDIVAEEDEEEE
ncbi:hypothetical protein ONZ51_g8176 [Trametes cubensis]|uniref:SET domain-containing protein n=1 Tax=Trametes cubensis TaxID=1111947 RepID=A0AAD7TNP5_9APHY|nr:hypothetical protein ONZ51_g8176 [Trametes cubensis]